MMLHKIIASKLCRLCGQEKEQATELFKEEIKGPMLLSMIYKYFSKEVINISIDDVFTKNICIECEHKLCIFDEFHSMVSNTQKQLVAPSLNINNFNEDMLGPPLKDTDIIDKITQNHQNIPNKRKYSCHICNKSFRCQAHLNRHKIIHTGERPFTCDICQMSFNQQEILTKHKDCHEVKKQFQCEHCHQSFRHKVSFKSHLISFHADLEPSILDNNLVSIQNQSLNCSECGKFFATKYKLVRHLRCHSGERPYQCNFCNRYFSQTGNLKMHQAKCHQMMRQINEGQEQLQQQVQNVEHDVSGSLSNFQGMYMTDTDIQNTLNETMNSINSTDPGTSFLDKSYDSSMYIDDEIETMLDHDLSQLESQKYNSEEKMSLCLKQPETPELLHSLLYDD